MPRSFFSWRRASCHISAWCVSKNLKSSSATRQYAHCPLKTRPRCHSFKSPTSTHPSHARQKRPFWKPTRRLLTNVTAPGATARAKHVPGAKRNQSRPRTRNRESPFSHVHTNDGKTVPPTAANAARQRFCELLFHKCKPFASTATMLVQRTCIL